MFPCLLEPSEHIFSSDVLSWLLKAWKYACHVPLLINSFYCHVGPSVISWIQIRILAAWIRIRIQIQENRDGFGFGWIWIWIWGVWIRIQDVRIHTSLIQTNHVWLVKKNKILQATLHQLTWVSIHCFPRGFEPFWRPLVFQVEYKRLENHHHNSHPVENMEKWKKKHTCIYWYVTGGLNLIRTLIFFRVKLSMETKLIVNVYMYYSPSKTRISGCLQEGTWKKS